MSDENWGAGDPLNWRIFGDVQIGNKRYPLFSGEHPHSRSENNHYVNMGRDEPVGFDGHRILIDVEITSSNYLKDSHLSGSNVRKGGSAKIIADGIVVYEFFHRDTRWALRRADQLIGELSEHSSGWLHKRDREKLVGRKIFWDRTPAIITRLVEDQGCVIIASEDGNPFPPPVWAEAGDDEREAEIKDDVLSSKIWWHRD